MGRISDMRRFLNGMALLGYNVGKELMEKDREMILESHYHFQVMVMLLPLQVPYMIMLVLIEDT